MPLSPLFIDLWIHLLKRSTYLFLYLVWGFYITTRVTVPLSNFRLESCCSQQATGQEHPESNGQMCPVLKLWFLIFPPVPFLMGPNRYPEGCSFLLNILRTRNAALEWTFSWLWPLSNEFLQFSSFSPYSLVFKYMSTFSGHYHFKSNYIVQSLANKKFSMIEFCTWTCLQS